MSAPFAPLTVLQRWLFGVLTADAAIITAIGGAGRIHPNYSPPQIASRHLVFEDYGGNAIYMPVGSPIGSVTMVWALTAWEPGPSQQALEPLMEVVMAALIDADTRGQTHRFVDGARTWSIYVDYAGGDKVPVEVAPAGIWAPIRETYTLVLQPLS